MINASAPRKHAGVSASKWGKLDYLRVESVDKRQRYCMMMPFKKTVGIRVGAAGVGVAGVMRCGKVICPSCGPRIGYERREDIQRAVDTWRKAGKSVLFMTLTLRHTRADPLRLMVSTISKCWRAATNGRAWMREKRDYAVAHTIRAWEEKWSIANGWHTHVHILLFIDAPSGSPEVDRAVSGLLPTFFDRWKLEALANGLGAPVMDAQDLHEVTGEDVGRKLGEYFAKQAAGTVDNAAEDMAWEMSNPNGKGRGDSFTPAEILELAVGGDPVFQALWAEYEKGMKGRRTIGWSTGMREALGMDAERIDQEIVDEEIGVAEDTVISMTSKSWVKLSRVSGARFELLRLVMVEGASVALDWLIGRGYHAVLGQHDFEEGLSE